MKKSLVILLAATLGLAACNTEKKGPGGLLYTIYKSKGADKIKEGDIVKINFIQKTEKDSLLSSTYENENPQAFPVQKKMYGGDIYDALTLLGEGDSATFKVNLDTMAFYSKQPKPEQFKKDKFWSFTVKVEKVYKKNAGEADSTFQKRAGEALQADFKALMEKRKAGEGDKIKAYIADKGLKTTTTASGLQYVIEKAGDAQKPSPTDTVELNYAGNLVKKGTDGKYKVFDTNIEKVAKDSKTYQMGRPYGPTKMVLRETAPGFAEAVQLIGKGGKITAVFPSKLGWGEQGSGPIGPYSPVAFEVEIVNIIKGAAAPVAFPAPIVAPTKK